MSFENCRFEDWKLEVASFDLVLAAVSIYWVDATVRYQKIADALKPEGYFASLWNEEWVSEDDVQEALTKVHFSVFDSSHPLYPKNKIPQEPHFFASEISECKLFSDVSIIEHPTWKTVRSKQDYIKFLLTKSGYAILPDEKKDELSSGIEEVLDRNGGQVEMTNVATLYLAQKRS